MTHSYARDMPHTYIPWLIQMQHDTFKYTTTHSYVPWLIHPQHPRSLRVCMSRMWRNNMIGVLAVSKVCRDAKFLSLKLHYESTFESKLKTIFPYQSGIVEKQSEVCTEDFQWNCCICNQAVWENKREQTHSILKKAHTTWWRFTSNLFRNITSPFVSTHGLVQKQ